MALPNIQMSPTLAVLAGTCALFLFSPYLPDLLLKVVVGNRVGALVTLVTVLYVLRKDIVLGLACFLAAAALFLESRRRTVIRVEQSLAGTKPPPFKVEQLNKPAPDLVRGEVHPPRQSPEVEDYAFEPTDDSGSNKMDGPDADSYEEKHPLDTVPPHPEEVSQFMQNKGLANINSA